MSTFVTLAVPCPGCDALEQRSSATGLNVTRSPWCRDEVLDGSFQLVRCGACDLRFHHLQPFTYLDFERRFLIAAYPVADEPRWGTLENDVVGTYRRTLGDQAPPHAQLLGEGFALRCVFGLGALREKVLLLESDLDDAWVEIAKLARIVQGEVTVGRVVAVAGGGALLDDGTSIDAAELARVQADDVLAAGLHPLMTEGPWRDHARLLQLA